MQFWQGGFVVDVLLLAVLFAGWWVVRSRILGWHRSAIPDAIVVGILGFVLGPQALAVLPFEYVALETLIYHGLAIVFITVALQSRPPSRGGSDIRSMAFAMPFIAAAQAFCGLGLVAAWTLDSENSVHPGFGLLLALGFQQGPGQALALGSAWETSGLPHGAALGLAYAAAGFLVCAVIGIPGAAWARRRQARGDGDDERIVDAPVPSAKPEATPAHPPTSFSLEPLTVHAAIVGTIYLATYGALLALTKTLPSHVASMVWGLHFVVAAGFALLFRAAFRRRASDWLDDRLLRSIGNLVVDFTTAAALVAVQLGLLGPWIGPFLATIFVGTVVTGAICWFLAPRMFRHERLPHAIVLFGASTGTLPTGLALLKMIDPQLRGLAAQTIVLATPSAVVLGLPLLLVVIPAAVSGWPARGLTGVWFALAILAGYLVVLGAGWAWLARSTRRNRP